MTSKQLKLLKNSVLIFSLVFLPILIGMGLLHLWHWDFSIPLAYGNPGADEIWQLVTTKTLIDTGWVLENPFLGAPDISTWYANSASQISVLHQCIMMIIGLFVKDAVAVQQYYYLISFSLISLTTFALARVLKINTLVAVVVSLIYTTTSFRLNALFFAYLVNYWIIPLTLIPIYYLLGGQLGIDKQKESGEERLYFLIGIVISVMVAITDGYYAFFYLLLLGFVVVNQFFNGEYSNLKKLKAPVVFILVTVVTTLIITAPLRDHRATFKHEANQDAMKSAIDAEVYVPTLKLLISPIFDHRIKAIDHFREKLLNTANFNRKFPYAVGAPVVLGSFGSLLLLMSFIRLLITNKKVKSEDEEIVNCNSIVLSSSKLSVFILMCSITGGVGTLIALFYPSIRAYERFPIYLILTLYIGAGAYLTTYLHQISILKKYLVYLLVVLGGVLIILDQTRSDTLSICNPQGLKDRTERFLAERQMVHQIENELVPPTMIYQYPYSQYLSDNKYYGWGQFGHLRQYLHSTKIRWSNGAAKGSYIDTWHEKESTLPLELLVTEMMSVGFDGIMIDRLVLSDKQYDEIKKVLSHILKDKPTENANAKMVYWRLPKSAILLKYDGKYQDANSIHLYKNFNINTALLPRIVNRTVLTKILNEIKPVYPIELSAEKFPTLFYSSIEMDRGLGFTNIENNEVKGGVQCEPEDKVGKFDVHSKINITILNQSKFDWSFDTGPLPMRVGVLVKGKDDQLLLDSRVDVKQYIKSGDSLRLAVNLSELINLKEIKKEDPIKIKIRVLQDGNRWFESPDISECRYDI